MEHQEIPEIDSKGLRKFGLILGCVLFFVPGVVLPWINHWQMLPNYYWVGVGAVVVLWALLAAGSMGFVYRNWMRLSMFTGNAVNCIILAIVFYFVMTPMGFVMRLMGKDPMHRRLDKNIESYRIISKFPPKTHVERPY